MGRFIIKIAGKYMEYSTVVDAIVSRPMTLEQFQAFYKDKYGTEGMKELPERLERVEDTGTSEFNSDLRSTLLCNRMYDGDDRFQQEEDGETYPDHSLTMEEVEAMVKNPGHPYWGE